jgi:nicotinate-nucleotide adenylyltransferase
MPVEILIHWRMPTPGEKPLLPITPFPKSLTLAKPRELIILGGSFDPPHLAHEAIVNFARQNACQWPDEAWACLIPAARSPHKVTGPLATASQRIDMLELMVKNLPRAVVWTDEVERAALLETNGADTLVSPSYTIDTLERLRTLLPHTKLYLILGEDQAKVFHRWHRPTDILNLVQPIIALRGQKTDLLHEITAAHSWTPSQMEAWSRSLLTNARIDISSTAIRERLGLINKDLARDAWLLERISPQVLEYIKAQKLYRTSQG